MINYILFIGNYEEDVVFYLTDKQYHYDWLMSSNKCLPNEIINDIINNEYNSYDSISVENIHICIKNGDDYISKSSIIFNACLCFYTFVDLYNYLNENSGKIIEEVLISL